MIRNTLGAGAALALAIASVGCNDGGGRTAVYLRVANLAPGAGLAPIDFCISEAGGPFEGPAMLYAAIEPDPTTSGLAYGMVSRYFYGLDGSYRIRIVGPAAISCATGMVPDVAVTLAPGSTTTVALVGSNAAGSRQPLQGAAFTDEWTPDPSGLKIRFVNTSPGLAPQDLGIGTVAGFTPILTDLGWLALATPTSSPPVDGNGFATVSPPSPVTVVTITTCATPPPPYSTQSCTETPLPPDVAATLTAGAVTSGFLVGIPTDATYPSQLLVCADRLGPVAGADLSACALVP
jgi:hypothetical protein